jgi:hypothetical protein
VNANQIQQLLKPINPRRVNSRDGMAYVEAHDIKAHLIRMFGFGGWSWEITSSQVIHQQQTQTKGGKDAWYVVAHTIGTLTVGDARYSGSHAGDSTHPVLGEAIGNALTNSDSYALKRAAICWGDQFGLSLYNKGSKQAIVGATLAGDAAPAGGDAVLPEPPVVHPETPEHPPPADMRETAGAPAGPARPAQTIADDVVALTGPARARAATLARLSTEAARGGLMNHQVTADGTVLSLSLLLDDRLKSTRLGAS